MLSKKASGPERQLIQITAVKGQDSVTLEVKPSETVDNVKAMLAQRGGQTADEQMLYFGGQEMVGGRLSHYGVSQDSVLQLRSRAIQMFVKGPEGKTHTLDVRTSDKVDHFMKLVHEKTGVQASQQNLMFGGKQLQAGHALSEYNIQDGSTAHLNMRLRGGLILQ